MSENIIRKKNWSNSLGLIGGLGAIVAIFWLITNCTSCH